MLVDWYKSVWEHGWRLRHFHRTGNWLIMEMNGLAQIGILYPQFLDASAWKSYAFDRLVEELDAQVYPDGFQVELSTGYHQVDIRNYQWLIDVCRAYDEPVPEPFCAGMERMHAVNVMMMMPDGRLPDVNDGGRHEDLLVAAPGHVGLGFVEDSGRGGFQPRAAQAGDLVAVGRGLEAVAVETAKQPQRFQHGELFAQARFLQRDADPLADFVAPPELLRFLCEQSLRNLRLRSSLKQEGNPLRIRHLRRDIARIGARANRADL